MHRHLLSALLLSVVIPACSASSSGSSTAPNALPAGCAESVCDLVHAHCTPAPCRDTCKECLDRCNELPVEYGAECIQACDGACNTGSSCPDTCDDDLAACRRTTANVVCADGIVLPPPSDEPSCGGAFLAAICRCTDADCEDRLMTANPACARCHEAYSTACTKAACPNELAAVQKAAADFRCEDDACIERNAPDAMRALHKCFLRASDDPADVGGCYSRSRDCWGSDPFCPSERELMAEP